MRNRCVPVFGQRDGYFGFGLAQLKAQIRLEIEDVGRILQSLRGPLAQPRLMKPIPPRGEGVLLIGEGVVGGGS